MPKNKLSQICNKSLEDSKAEDVLNLNVKGISSFADEIIIATANSNRHAKSISEKLVDLLKNEKMHIIGVEGEVESGWILVDCGSIVINIMKKEQREFYDLEGLWGRSDFVISWDSTGKQLDSYEFSNFILDSTQSKKEIFFIIGGSHGLSMEVLNRSNQVFSASLLTFPHRLFRLILMEQIYRAFSIMQNKPYHK